MTAVVDHSHVKAKHRAQLAQRSCDITGAYDIKRCAPVSRIDEQTGRTVAFNMSDRLRCPAPST